MPLRLHLRRLIWLGPLGLLLAAVSGYIGAMVLPVHAAVLEVDHLPDRRLFRGAGRPSLYGLRWFWPVTCVALPLASLAIHRASMSTPFVLVAVGAAACAAMGYLGAAGGYDSLNPDDAPWFALAGLALRRADCHV